MTKEEYLETAILSSHKSIMSFAKDIDIPYTTVKGMLHRGISGAAVQTALKVCHALGIDIEYLMDEKYNLACCEVDDTQKSSLTPAQTEANDGCLDEIIELYHELNEDGQEHLLKTARYCSHDTEYKKCDKSKKMA